MSFDLKYAGLQARIANLESYIETLEHALREAKDAEFCECCGELLIKGYNVVDEHFCSQACAEDVQAEHEDEMAFQESVYQRGR
jgi:hypothetical protein